MRGREQNARTLIHRRDAEYPTFEEPESHFGQADRSDGRSSSVEWFRNPNSTNQDDTSPISSDEAVNELTERLASTSVGLTTDVPMDDSKHTTLESHGEETEATMPPVGTVIAVSDTVLDEPIAPVVTTEMHPTAEGDSPMDEASDTTNIYDQDAQVWITTHRDEEEPEWDDGEPDANDGWQHV